MKVVCLLLPHFPLRCEILRQKASNGRPTIVLQTKGGASSQRLVLDFSPDLERLQPGMSLQQALSLYGEAGLAQADIPFYRSVFNEVLDRLEEKSPLVEGTEPGCAYIGMDGLQFIYPDDGSFIDAVKGVIPDVFKARFGIAEGKFPAYLRALYTGDICPGQTTPMQAKDFDNFLKDLPCDVLPVSSRSKSKLHEYGIRTLGQISALPQGPLQAQFGKEGKRITDLARGHDDTPLYPRSMEETIEDETTLASVTVSLEAILATLEALLSRAFSRRGMKGRGIRSLTLWTRSWDGMNWERGMQFKEIAMDAESMTPRIKLALEEYPQPGPIEQIGIRITRLGYGDGRQRSLFSEFRAKDHLMDDIKQLDLRLGDHQVFKIKEVEPWSRIPERRYTLTPLN